MKETTKEAKEETKAVIKEEQPKPATFPEAEKATKKQVYYYCFLTYRDKEERQKQVAIMLKDESLSKKELSNMIDKAKKEYYRQKEERKFEWRKEHGYKGKEEAPASKKQEEKHEDKQQPRKPQVGDIYYFSFGYDATFYRFYQIIALKGSFATVREVEPRSERVDSTGYGPNAWKTKKHITPGEILPAVQRTGEKPQDRKRKISYCKYNYEYYFVADDALKAYCYLKNRLTDGQIFLEDDYH